MSFDPALIREKIYTAVLSDILDDMGCRSQTMNIAIEPLQPETILFGRARTMLAVPDSYGESTPYMTQIEAVDALEAGDVVVAATSGVETSAFWGELFSSAAVARKSAGAIIDGYIRDVRRVKELDYPLFSRGTHPGNSKGRLTVAHYDQPIECGGVRVRTGDYIFAEIDGVVVVPHEIAGEVIEKALNVASLENHMKKALFDGMSLKDAYLKYRVL